MRIATDRTGCFKSKLVAVVHRRAPRRTRAARSNMRRGDARRPGWHLITASCHHGGVHIAHVRPSPPPILTRPPRYWHRHPWYCTGKNLHVFKASAKQSVRFVSKVRTLLCPLPPLLVARACARPRPCWMDGLWTVLRCACTKQLAERRSWRGTRGDRTGWRAAQAEGTRTKHRRSTPSPRRLAPARYTRRRGRRRAREQRRRMGGKRTRKDVWGRSRQPPWKGELQ